MSLKRFCGWVPAMVTEHEYDDRGRVIRSVTRSEVEWDDGQRMWMLALAHYEASLCRKCGHDLHDTTSGDDTVMWLAETPIECASCSALARAERKFTKRQQNDGDPTPPEAMIYTVRKVRRPPRVSPGERKRRVAEKKRQREGR